MYKEIFLTLIKSGNYNLDELSVKLDKMYIEGKLTEAERDELLLMATDGAKDSAQIDLYEKIVDLEHRVVALENKGKEEEYAIWVSGYTTNKGETVRFDYDGDGVLDLLRYDGGRSYTSLAPGKIDGWYVVDIDGNVLGTYYKGEFTPIEPAVEPVTETPVEGE